MDKNLYFGIILLPQTFIKFLVFEMSIFLPKKLLNIFFGKKCTKILYRVFFLVFTNKIYIYDIST